MTGIIAENQMYILINVLTVVFLNGEELVRGEGVKGGVGGEKGAMNLSLDLCTGPIKTRGPGKR